MTHVCTFFFTVTVMEMKHTQEYLLDTLSPPVVYREGSSGGGSGQGGVLPRAGVLTGYKSGFFHVAVHVSCFYIISL